MEAYSKVHETPEVLSEEVLDLSDEDLEGIELIEMTMEEIDQLNEAGQPGAAIAQQAKAQRVAAQQQVSQRLGSGGDIKLRDANPLRPNKPFSNPLSGSALPKQSNRAFGTQLNGRQGVVVKNAVGQGRGFAGAADTVNVAGQTLYKAKRGKDVVYLQGKGKPKLFEPKGNKPAKPETPTPPPTKPKTPTTAPSKPGTPTATKPTTPPAAPTKPAGSAMDQWRAANPKLAAAADEKARIRGTSQTDNPLMKDMRSKMSMTPSVQSPTLAKDLGGGSGNQSLLNNPNASKAATPKPAAAAKPTPGPKTTTTTGNSKDKDKEDLFAHVDIFDLVKGHLLDEGYADSEEGAMVIMVNMSEEWRKSILEAHGVQQLDEISQKTATSAYASSKTGEFEGADSDRDVKRTDNLKKHIVRKFGKEAGEHADKAAEAQTFGRKDASGRRKQTAKPRIEKSDYRTTEDGKMHKQDQRELKTELRIKRDRRLRKEDLEAWVDELIAEGYDLSEYTWEEVAEIYAQELELSEAQRARENPEDHDKEEKRKYEPVRGERTPMPPRGDKRREEFEKWYAKQMGR